MAKVLVAPKEDTKATIGIHVEETVFMNWSDAEGIENFVRDHLSLDKLLKMMCCPLCCVFVPFTGKKNKIEYTRECGCCKCPYAVRLNGARVGKVHDVGCCDNGALFCCCPLCTCSGYIKIMGMDGRDGSEKFVFAKSLFPCWKPIDACATYLGGSIGMCLVSMYGCCNYCKGTEIQTITQPVYKGPWKRTLGTNPEAIGEFTISNRYNPVCCCFACPTPMKFYFKPTTEYGQNLVNDDLAALALVLSLYRGLPIPCKQCSPAGFQKPMGVPCFDLGLGTRTLWKTVQAVMRDSDEGR